MTLKTLDFSKKHRIIEFSLESVWRIDGVFESEDDTKSISAMCFATQIEQPQDLREESTRTTHKNKTL